MKNALYFLVPPILILIWSLLLSIGIQNRFGPIWNFGLFAVIGFGLLVGLGVLILRAVFGTRLPVQFPYLGPTVALIAILGMTVQLEMAAWNYQEPEPSPAELMAKQIGALVDELEGKESGSEEPKENWFSIRFKPRKSPWGEFSSLVSCFLWITEALIAGGIAWLVSTFEFPQPQPPVEKLNTEQAP